MDGRQSALSRKRTASRAIRRSLVPTEADEQIVVVDWWRSYAPTVHLDARLLVCSSNGAILGGNSRLRAIQMDRLKRMGLVPGDPDLFLRVCRGGFAGLYIEMKRLNWIMPKSGRALAHVERQREVRDILSANYACHVSLGAVQGMIIIKDYLALK